MLTELFADDVGLHPVACGVEGHTKLLEGVAKAETWADKWGLVWSVKKSLWMWVRSKRLSRPIGTFASKILVNTLNSFFFFFFFFFFPKKLCL